MSKIRSKDTKAELLVFAAMRSRGIAFQKHYSRALGTPDLARPRKKLAVFVDGDFWHGRDIDRIAEKHGTDSVWAEKLRKNINRDRVQETDLTAAGWGVLRVWESDVVRVRTRELSIESIATFLMSRG